jgi:hypothetical protein
LLSLVGLSNIFCVDKIFFFSIFMIFVNFFIFQLIISHLRTVMA